MLADAVVKGVKQPKTDMYYLCNFVSNEGLAALKKLESLGDRCGTACAVKQFRARGEMFVQREYWFVIHDEMWLRTTTGQDISLNATDIISQYPEAESGPQVAWLHTLLQSHIEDQMFDNGIRLCFRCDHHAPEWGYAYWDLQRLEAITRGSLPTMEQLLSASNTLIPPDDLCFYANFREDVTCICV